LPTQAAALDPTQAPQASATPVPASPLPLVAAEGQIELTYDAGALLLLNRSEETLDLSGINFVQVLDDGQALDFPVSRWEGGTAPTFALPPGDCFQVLTTQVAVSEPPEDCGIRHKWDQASFPRWFWISQTPGAVFEVRRDDQVLALCQIDAGECRFDLSE
jgi:hypothetical protein